MNGLLCLRVRLCPGPHVQGAVPPRPHVPSLWPGAWAHLSHRLLDSREWALLRKQPSEVRPVCVTVAPSPLRGSLSEPVPPPGEQGCGDRRRGACQVLEGEV